MNKLLLVLIAVILLISSLFIYIKLQEPECYLIEEDKSCGVGYYNKYQGSCWVEFRLKQCCKGRDYIMKGVYGDRTCQWIKLFFGGE